MSQNLCAWFLPSWLQIQKPQNTDSVTHVYTVATVEYKTSTMPQIKDIWQVHYKEKHSSTVKYVMIE